MNRKAFPRFEHKFSLVFRRICAEFCCAGIARSAYSACSERTTGPTTGPTNPNAISININAFNY